MSSRAAKGGTRTTAKGASNKTFTASQNRQFQRSYAQYLKWAKAHPKQAAAARKRRTAKRGAPAPATVEPGYWIAGDNDTEATCVSVALANAILAQTGRRASSAELGALHVACGDAEGAFMTDALDALTGVTE